MKTWKFEKLLQKDGWHHSVCMQTDDSGTITSISDKIPENLKVDELVTGWALPGFPNAHSHAFQYAMAGLAENFSSNANDDFWGWRQTMYRLANQINPEQMEAIATTLYSEMVRLGYSWVAEFHYLHHDSDGKPYSNPNEMSQRLISAAQKSGIGITLIPVFYKNANFGEKAKSEQKRFLFESTETYFELIGNLKKLTDKNSKAKIGLGVHSLRAADPKDIQTIFNQSPETPKHIHIAEQTKEVEDCLNHHKLRPVEWLLENTNLNENDHLVHATHTTSTELKNLVKQKANVVLCPSTEGNLGDGFFDLETYQNLGGSWSTGTDSHIGLNPFEEIRWLIYGQRLKHQKRNIPYSKASKDSSQQTLNQCILTGRRALGIHNQDFFEVGSSLDALIIKNWSLLENTPNPSQLSTIIYSSDPIHLAGTILSGQWLIKEHQHTAQNKITQEFQKALKELRS